MLVILWCKLSSHESYLLMKVMIVKEVMTCDVSPVAMFSSTVVVACEDGRLINPIEILNCQKVVKKLWKGRKLLDWENLKLHLLFFSINRNLYFQAINVLHQYAAIKIKSIQLKQQQIYMRKILANIPRSKSMLLMAN